MRLTKWHPVNTLDVFRNFDELFEHFPHHPRRFSRSGESVWSPRIDVIESEKAYELRAELPGIDKKELNISVKNDVLTISGEKKGEEKKEGDDYYCCERRFGNFERSFRMADTVDSENVSAEYKEGVLVVTVPKVEIPEPKATKIVIK